jgi:primosomal protein N'
MNNNSFDNQSDQFVLSQELVQLMDWIIKHNAEGLKKVIEVAISKARSERKRKKAKQELYDSELYENDELQGSIIDFFSLLEKSLYEVESQHSAESYIQKQLMPAIEHVDTSVCDELTLSNCAALTANKVKKQPKKDAKDLFLKELLKLWKPGKGKKN